MQTQTVVVTGASAGIGRATARLFGQRGARVALIARGQAGLDGAARDVQEAGGQSFAISADVADYEQVTTAADKIEETLGPIDVWINVAFTSVFAPFTEISPEESAAARPDWRCASFARTNERELLSIEEFTCNSYGPKILGVFHSLSC